MFDGHYGMIPDWVEMAAAMWVFITFFWVVFLKGDWNG